MARRIVLLVSLLACAVAVVLSLWLTFQPESRSTVLAPYIMGALLVAVAAGWRLPRPRPDWGWAALGGALVLMVPVTAIARAFGSIDMLALVFHMEFGTEGAGFGGLKPDLAVGVFAGCAVFLAVIVFAHVSGLRCATWAAALALVLANPVLRGFVAMALPVTGERQETMLQHFVEPAIPPDTGRTAPDVVIVYLEGMDRIFADIERFGDAMDRVLDLAGPGVIDLRGVGPMIGTGWSLSGMAASQCGVPVMPNGLRFELNLDDQVRFMSEVTCLSDVLIDRGYRAEFIVGGDVGFGGADHFYRSHGVTDQTDPADMAAMMPPEEFEAAFLGWVVDDQMVMDVALRRHAELTAGEAPVLLIVETSGPHGIEVWMSRRCTATGKAEVLRDNGAGVRCTGGIVADFIETLRDAPTARPTLFVVLSDHINHNPALRASDPVETRRNTVLLIPPESGAEAGPVRVIDREAAMIDVYPTILDLLGLIPPGGGAGLGVSLLGDGPTLVERYGREEADRRLARDAALAARLWQ